MNKYDVIIVGAGAAGLMAGIAAAQARVTVEGTEHAARVLVLDSQSKIGAKILVAGGGRCNVTNEFVDASRFHTSAQSASVSKSFVARVLRSFSVEQTHRFFDAVGVPLKLEETGKYFPVSDSARTVLGALLKALRDAGAELCTETPVNAINKVEDGWLVRTPEGEIHTRAVIICTGGLALPKSGSNGAGYEFARRIGHTVVSTTPALSPLLANPPRHANLSGITLPVRLTLRDGSKNLAQYSGSFLFTHVGYSGPVALNISRHVARERDAHPDAAVFLRLLTDVEDGEEGRFWHAFSGRNAKKSIFNALSEILPNRVVESVLSAAKVQPNSPVGKLSPNFAKEIQREMLDIRLPISGVAPYVKAETTAGGICLDEIEPATMMSRLASGLFFAGEVCDVDGWLGGYNFQWAWSSGTVAGRAAARLALRGS
ncbi:MAG TPA: aminoacetone oxidase family FAD-binding enzyme [Abditibacteriaceae bacterium]